MIFDDDAAELVTAEMGLARCSIRNGKHAAGMQMARRLEDRALFGECGDLLEGEKQYTYAVSDGIVINTSTSPL